MSIRFVGFLVRPTVRVGPSVRGELLVRLGRTAEARTELEQAARLCGNGRERTALERKLTEFG